MKTQTTNAQQTNTAAKQNPNSRFKRTAIASLTAFALSVSAFSSVALQTEHQPLSKQEASVNQAVGLGSGVIIGAAVAGPIGATIAGIIGAFIADDVNNKHRLADNAHLLLVKQTELHDMQFAFAELKQQSDMQLAAFEASVKTGQDAKMLTLPEVTTNIQFKTASFLVEPHYKDQLDVLAKQLKDNPDFKVVLSGFADQRGDSNYNQVLSEQRNAAVKDYLMSKWVPEAQIITQAFGENNVANAGHDAEVMQTAKTQQTDAKPNNKADHEDYFFDRRVMLKVAVDPKVDMTAATHTEL